MNIAVLHPQCRVRGGAIKMALLSAQSLTRQGHRVMFYTFDHDPECFPDLQDGLTIATMNTTRKTHTTEPAQKTKDTILNEGIIASGKAKPNFDTVDRLRSFGALFHTLFPRISSIISIAWDIRQVDIIIAHNPPMQIVAALAKIFSIFSEYHQRLVVIWWHHHTPWYYVPIKTQNAGVVIADKQKKQETHSFSGDSIARFFSPTLWKGFFERHLILPRIKYLIATSEYTAYCIEKYCGRKAIVMHPVITSPSFQPSPEFIEGREVESHTVDSLRTFDDKSTKMRRSEGISLRTDKNSPNSDSLEDTNSPTSECQLRHSSPKNPSQNAQEETKGVFTRPITLFSHGRLEPGKGMDTLIKVWKELQNTKDKIQSGGTAPVIPAKDEVREVESRGKQTISSKEMKGDDLDSVSEHGMTDIRLIIAGDGSLKNWLIEQGATVISYQESVLEDIKKTESDILAIYLSTIDAFGMAPLEAQIAGLPVIILDKGGARETVLLDNNSEPMAQLIDTENELLPAIKYFIQQRSLQKRMSNVNFCHQREYFSVSRLDAEIHSLIDSIR